MNAPLADWERVRAELDADGAAVLRGVLDADACAGLRALYGEPARFRSRVVMQRHGYGQGEYQYFAYPLPPPVQALRETAYAQLAPLAARWAQALGESKEYPPDLAGYLAQCHAAGQLRPTPLLLRYGAGDYNRLHQDLYGAQVFPLQMVVLLSEPGTDFGGGELVLVEQRARMQSRPLVLPLARGDAAIFAVNRRPAPGPRGPTRVALRHGVSRVAWGERLALGVILHDAT